MFIVTVPHARCRTFDLEAGVHTCDTLARRAAESIASELARVGADVVGPIVGNTNRRDAPDLNRSGSRDSRFRDEIASEIRKTNGPGRRPFVVDVHSFNPGAGWEHEGRGEPLIVFLDGRRAYGIPGIPERLKGMLPSWLADRTSVGGSIENDIVATAVDSGASGAVLIEFSEAELADGRGLQRIVVTLASILVSLQRSLIE
jgi:predicted N-formylglutamate amidohydrolase